MKFVWVLLAVILVVIIMNPPDLERRSTTAEKPPTAAAPFHPNAIAKSLTAAPGAIVCPDFASVRLLFGLYKNYWEDSMQDTMTNGQSRILRGPSAPAPDPALYGCSLLKPGTPVEARNGEGLLNGIPMVTAKLQDGTMIHGVTIPNMLSAIPLPSSEPKSLN